VITEYFALDDINAAMDRMRNGELSGRCLIRMMIDGRIDCRAKGGLQNEEPGFKEKDL